MEIVASSKELGNTHSPVPPKQSPSRKGHFFTYNNYKDEDVVGIIKVLKTFSYKGKVQSEIGEQGTPHLQGMIWCNESCRDTEFKLPKQIHWQALKDTFNKSNYCGKTDTFDGKHRYSWGFPDEPAEIKCSVMWNTWTTYIRELCDEEPDGRCVNWFWSHKGKMGKTQMTRWLVKNKNASFASGGKYTDVMNLIYHTDMNKCNCVVFGIPKGSKNISYSSLEAIKDGLVSNMKSFRNGSKIFNPPHVIVFANFPPNCEELMEDRWNIVCLDRSELKTYKGEA